MEEPNVAANQPELSLDLIKNQQKREILKGLAWYGGGVIITLISYVLSDPGGSYFLTWGPILFGLYLMAVALYRYFNPASQLDEKAVQELDQISAAKSNNALLAGLYALLSLALLIGLSAGITKVVSPDAFDELTGNSVSADDPELLKLDEEVQSLEQRHDACLVELDPLTTELETNNAELDQLEAAGDSDAFDAKIPAQNALADKYGAKYDECEALRAQYNAKVSEYNDNL